MKFIAPAFFSLCLSLAAVNAFAAVTPNQSPDLLWFKTSALARLTAKPAVATWVAPQTFVAVSLDHAAMRAALARSPQTGVAAKAAAGVNEITLPMPDGTFQRFRVEESPVMTPELAAKFPEIKTYVAQGVDDPAAVARLDLTPAGFHAQILSPNGAVYIDPHLRDASVYASYFKRDYRKPANEFLCRTLPGKISGAQKISSPKLARSGGNLRTYRLAVAATAEYTAFQGGTVTAGMAAIVTAVNRVTGVYENELAVRLVLVGNNNLLVYTNAATDPYSNADSSALLDQNQTTLDSVIGSANYDIGHVFSTAGGGLAGLGVVCVAGQKAQGETGLDAPTGDAFYIDYVAHEMGHQFGGDHTFNSSLGSCGGGNRNASTAYEPGSGSTIMAYAGICSTDDLQAHSDPYFHSGSFDEIITYSATNDGNSCAVITSTGNHVPTASAGAASHTIPKNTPFTLTASGSDADGDMLTYCWEERDLGASATIVAADNGSSPIFRSFNPTTNPARTFPQLSDILSNVTTVGEKLPTTTRTLNFRVTVRDNRAGGGGVATADTSVSVVGTAGPFALTSHNVGGVFAGGTTVTWSVAGTTAAGINCAAVNILLSTNSGQTFNLTLASGVTNSGAAFVVLPNLTLTTARLRVEAVGNIFFTVSKIDFALGSDTTPPTVAVTSGTTLIGNSANVAGTAADNGGIASVRWGLNGGDVTNIATGTTSWSFTVVPPIGSNTVVVQSVDLNGNVSAFVTNQFFFSVPQPLSVFLVGSGTVTPNLNSSNLVVTRSYSMVAAPAANFIFDRWLAVTSGVTNLVTLSNTCTFTMQSNLTLIARFATNNFPAVAGKYNGLFSEATVTHQSAGFLAATVTAQTKAPAKFSGALKLDGESLTFTGAFDVNGDTSVTVPRSHSAPM
jgi:hypothetical protein